MPVTRVKSPQIGDAEVKRADLNTATSGSAVITKVVAGAGISLSSTGVDAGTGDVTVSATGAFGYISNYGAETNATGWTASGANFTASRTTTSGEVLKGTASLKLTANGSQAVNDYIYHSFTLDAGDTNSLLAVQFYFKGISNYDSGDCEVVFHDGTNEILPSVTSIPGGNGFFEATWVSTGATSYQIRFKAKVTTAFSLVVDDVFVANQKEISGFAAGYIGSETLTITGAVTNPTKGTTSLDVAHVFRRGKFAHIIYDYSQTTAGSAGSSAYRWVMPFSLEIDTNYTPLEDTTSITYLGNIGWGEVNNATTISSVTVHASNSTKFALIQHGTNGEIGSSSYSLANTTLRISLHLIVPIVGWDETTVLQNSRVEYAYNSDTTNASDTTSFAYGIDGGLVPVVATSPKSKRLRFQTPVQPTDLVQLQVKLDGSQWVDAASAGFNFYSGGGSDFGIAIEPVNSTDLDVVFSPNGVHAHTTEATSNTWTTENTAGTRWRVIKCANPLAVESPNIVEEVEVSYVTSGSGGSATSGSEADLTLNAINNPQGYSWIVGPSSNAVTLHAGTYSFTGYQSFYNTGRTHLFIKNTTDSVYLGNATGFLTTNSGGVIPIVGFAVLTKDTSIKMRYEVETTQSTDGLGVDASLTQDNTFTKLKIQRLG